MASKLLQECARFRDLIRAEGVPCERVARKAGIIWIAYLDEHEAARISFVNEADLRRELRRRKLLQVEQALREDAPRWCEKCGGHAVEVVYETHHHLGRIAPTMEVVGHRCAECDG